MGPTAPAWFVRKLKALSPHFDVKWDERRQKWAILEWVRWSTYVSDIDGAPVLRRHRRPMPALYVAGLGSRVIEWVRRNDPRRFRSMREMIDKLDIDDRHGYKRPALTPS